MPRLGREFEKLIARIEKTLSPLGAVVTSPDRIKDSVTGGDREVDVSIRYTGDSGCPVLITVECRDRTSAQDIMWLEQIKSKKESIGADQTIVVSREGFTKGAITYANHHGIILRQLPEVTDAFWIQSLNGLKVFTREMRCHMVSVNIGFFSKVGDEGLDQLSITEEVARAIEENRPFAQNKAGDDLTLEDLYREVLPELKDELAEHLDSVDGGFNSQEFIEGYLECDAMFAPNDVATETVRGTRYIQVIIFGVKYEVTNTLLPPLKPMQYTDERGRIVDSFSMTTDVKGGATVRLKTGWDRT